MSAARSGLRVGRFRNYRCSRRGASSSCHLDVAYLRKVSNTRWISFADDVVDHEEIRSEGEHRDDHHRRGRSTCFHDGPRHPPHFELELVEIILDVLSGHSLSAAIHFAIIFPLFLEPKLSRLSRQTVSRGGNGRGGGIRTPTRGFGDRWSAVKPTPLLH